MSRLRVKHCPCLQAFTLVELLSTIAILAIIVAVAVPYIGNYVAQARQTSERQNLEVLNDAINRYKMQGGNLNALTDGKSRGRLLTLLQTPINWNGVTHQFLRSSFTLPSATTLSAAGSGRTYRLTQYGSYTGEAGGSEVPETVVWPPLNLTGLVGYYNFDDNQDAHSSNNDLSEENAPTYSGGYGITNKTGPNCWSMLQGGFPNGDVDKSIFVRFRARDLTGTQNIINRVARDTIQLNGSTLRAGLYAWEGFDYHSYAGVIANTWYSACITLNGATSEQKLYINGTQVASGILGECDNSSGGAGIGGEWDGTNPANIDIANLSLWARELTPSEVERLHNGGADLNYADL